MRGGAACLALGVAALAGVAGVRLGREFYRGAPYHYDSAAYLWGNLTLDRQARESPVLEVAAGRLRGKDALSPVLRLLVVPASLRQRFGHLWVALPCLALYVYLLVRYVASRGGSLPGAAAVVAALFAFPLLWEPGWGLPDDVRENEAAWLLGAAVLAFLRSRWLGHRGWAFGVGALLGVLVLDRTVVGVFGGAILLPLLALATLRRLREDPRGLATSRVVAFVAPVLVVAALTLTLQAESLYRHYVVGGYAYTTPASAFRELWPLFAARLGWGPFAVLAAAPFACGLALPGRDRRGDVWVASWAVLALPLVVLGGGLVYIGFPTLWSVLLVTWLATLLPPTASAVRPRALVGVLAVAAVAAAVEARAAMRSLAGPLDPLHQRPLFARVAEVLGREPGATRMKFLVDEVDELFLCQAHFDHGITFVLRGRGLVSVHDAYFRAHFGDLSVEAIASANLRYLARGAAGPPGAPVPRGAPWAQPWVLAYCSPEGVDRNPAFAANGRQVAQPVLRAMNRSLQEDPAWRSVERWRHPVYGCVELFRYAGGP